MFSQDTILIRGLRQNNLKNVSVDIPLNVLTVVTGVAGSGKSSLIRDVFAKQYQDRVALVDQSPVTATGRSTPATFLGFFDEIRKVVDLYNKGNIYVLDEPTTGLHASDVTFAYHYSRISEKRY